MRTGRPCRRGCRCSSPATWRRSPCRSGRCSSSTQPARRRPRSRGRAGRRGTGQRASWADASPAVLVATMSPRTVLTAPGPTANVSSLGRAANADAEIDRFTCTVIDWPCGTVTLLGETPTTRALRALRGDAQAVRRVDRPGVRQRDRLVVGVVTRTGDVSERDRVELVGRRGEHGRVDRLLRLHDARTCTPDVVAGVQGPVGRVHDRGLDLQAVPPRMDLLHERRDTGRHRAGHRGARDHSRARARANTGRDDAQARSDHVRLERRVGIPRTARREARRRLVARVRDRRRWTGRPCRRQRPRAPGRRPRLRAPSRPGRRGTGSSRCS